MKRALLLLVWLLLPVLSFAQGIPYNDFVQLPGGGLVSNPSVAVCGFDAVTAFSVTSGVVTFTVNNDFTAGNTITITGLSTGTYFNGHTFTVLSKGLSATQFEANVNHVDVGQTSDVGQAVDRTDTPCDPRISIYSDEKLTTSLANPFVGDQYGTYNFWAPAGHVIVQVYKAGIVARAQDVVLADSLATPVSVAEGGTGSTTAGNNIPTSLPVPVSDGGTGTSSPTPVAGNGISITGTWPNNTITNSQYSYFTSGILALAHGGTGTTSPALGQGSHIGLSGTWPNNTIAVTGTQGTDSNLLTSGTISGTGATLCTDANGGATTSGCSTTSGTVANWTTSYPSSLTATATGAETVMPSTQTAVRVTVWLYAAPVGCTTYPRVAFYNISTSTQLWAASFISGQQLIDSGTVSFSLPEGNTVAFEVTTAASGCSTTPQGPVFTVWFE